MAALKAKLKKQGGSKAGSKTAIALQKKKGDNLISEAKMKVFRAVQKRKKADVVKKKLSKVKKLKNSTSKDRKVRIVLEVT